MTTPSTPTDPAWLPALLDPRTYPHAVHGLELIETHISRVVLTGDLVYKLKKPVNYGFIDFSSVERRQRFCEEEVRLNQRTAPEIYLGVVPLRRLESGFHFGGQGEIVEPAVCMRQFPAEARLDRIAVSGHLTNEVSARLAAEVAKLHAMADASPSSIAATHPARLARIFRDNSLLLPDSPRERSLRERFASRMEECGELLSQRANHGRVRECHGDLHLGNICLWKGQPVLFDCIEFSEDLRMIDVLSDTAFLYMDLVGSGLKERALRFLDRYLEVTGDYGGLAAWPIFVAYRAHVRAMVAHLSSQPGRRDRYLSLAEEELSRGPRGLVLTAGLPGSGKSTEALRIAGEEGGVRIRSDVERKRLQTLRPGLALYSAEMSRLVYESLLSSARSACLGGLLAVLDATFLRREDRARALRLAQELGVPARIVHLSAPLQALKSRIRARRESGNDPSDADEEVLSELASRFEPFTPEETPLVTHVRSER